MGLDIAMGELVGLWYNYVQFLHLLPNSFSKLRTISLPLINIDKEKEFLCVLHSLLSGQVIGRIHLKYLILVNVHDSCVSMVICSDYKVTSRISRNINRKNMLPEVI